MRLSHFAAMALIVTLHLVVPLVLIIWTLRKTYASISEFVVMMLALISYITFIYLMGTWVFASYYLRYALIVLTLAAVVRSLLQIRNLPLFVKPHFMGWIGYSSGIVFLAVLVYLIIGGIGSYYYDETPVNLAFPFKNGIYSVFEGGNGRASSLMNYHYSASIHRGANINTSMRYAVDITQVGYGGNDANGFLPTQNEKYHIFNQVVYSPCDGEVFDVEDKWPNETPWTGKPPYNVGNHILIVSKDFGVLMGHLQQGSILIKKGAIVTKGQPIAKVGNSGWTSQPHLHIQAMKKSSGLFWKWEGIPIFFDNKNPVKNSLFFER